jgi:hypothetical protein
MYNWDGNAPVAAVDAALSSTRKRQRYAEYYFIVSIATDVSANESMS